MADLTATLRYSRDEGPGKRPYIYSYQRTEEELASSPHKDQDGTVAVPVEVVVRDGRGLGHSLDTHSFQLEQAAPTALSTEDFYDNNAKVVDVYYKEVAELIKKATGAEHVEMFHHQVRNAERSNATSASGTNTSIQPYANGIHSDSHAMSAKGIFSYFAGNLDKKFHKGRFLYINAWRNISETPIGNDHLAVCDETSLIKPDDYQVSDFFDKTYSLQQYRLLEANAGRHRWFYFPAMRRDEVILFKQWDSDPTLPGRMCFHTSFHDPAAPGPPGAAPRQSVEARGLAFFPDHQPNTCPTVADPQSSEAENPAEP